MTMGSRSKDQVDCIDVITNLAKILKQHKDCRDVLAITTAKVPIVKFHLRSCCREGDISLYNTLALENTKMLAAYCQLDERVSILGYTVKVFAKASFLLFYFFQKKDSICWTDRLLVFCDRFVTSETLPREVCHHTRTS